MNKVLKKIVSCLLSLSLIFAVIVPSTTAYASDTNLSKKNFALKLSCEEHWYDDDYTLNIEITNNSNSNLKNVYVSLDAPSDIKIENTRIDTELGAGETRVVSTTISNNASSGFFQKIISFFRNIFYTIFKGLGLGSYQSASCKAFGTKITAKLYWKESLKADDSVSYTKGEWVKLLADKLEINTDSINDDWNYFYADTESSPYGKYAETMNAYGILPMATNEGYVDINQDIPLFNEDEIATREFASYTVVKALGFTGEETINCSDASVLKYPSEDAIAVNQKIIYLHNNSFLPNAPLNEVDCATMLSLIEKINASTIISENDFKEKIAYKSDVIKDSIDNITDYTVSETDGIYTVNISSAFNTSNIKSGEVIVLKPNSEWPTGISVKVSSIVKNGDTYVITGTKPEIEEVYTDIYYCGGATIDENSIKPADGITCEYDPNGVIDKDESDYPIDIKKDKSTSIPGTLKFTFANKKISENVKATGSLSVEIPDISVKVDAHIGLKTKLNELLISITPKLKVQGQLTYTVAESGYELTNDLGNTRWESGRVDLGAPVEFPLGSTGLSIALHFFYTVNVKGEGSISYTLVPTMGIQYINGSFRTIHDYTHSLDLFSLKGSAKIGVGMAVDLAALGLMDLLGIDAHTGLGINLSFTVHICEPQNLYCGDATIYLYGTLELDPETVLGKFLSSVLKISVSWDFWTESSSPLKAKFHVENLKIVPECTFGTGALDGTIKDASNKNPIKNARVNIYSGSSLLKTVYTDSEGHYSIHSMNQGDYSLTVSATGYYSYNAATSIVKNRTTYVETSLMVNRNGDLEGEFSGNILDATTANSVTNVTYKVRSGWDNKTGEITSSSVVSSSSFNITLPAGNYTVEFSKDGYITNYLNIAVVSGKTENKDIILSPVGTAIGTGDTLRVVLTWGPTPSDLDSHMYGPSSNGGQYHVYYSSQNYNESGSAICNLDVDDTSSYGPETTTVYHLQSTGTYSFYVHDYSNKGSNYSMAMANSGAKVAVYVGNVLVATYSMPSNKACTLWHVFDFDASSRNLLPVNSFSYANAG